MNDDIKPSGKKNHSSRGRTISNPRFSAPGMYPPFPHPNMPMPSGSSTMEMEQWNYQMQHLQNLQAEIQAQMVALRMQAPMAISEMNQAGQPFHPGQGPRHPFSNPHSKPANSNLDQGQPNSDSKPMEMPEDSVACPVDLSSTLQMVPMSPSGACTSSGSFHYKCTLCNALCNSMIHWQTHVHGKKHQRKLAQFFSSQGIPCNLSFRLEYLLTCSTIGIKFRLVS